MIAARRGECGAYHAEVNRAASDLIRVNGDSPSQNGHNRS